MMNWPDNKRIAVMMAFDLDAETMWTTHGDGIIVAYRLPGESKFQHNKKLRS